VGQYASTFGYNGDDPAQAEQFILNVFNTYFQGGKCIYMLGSDTLKNRDCCQARGGEWNSELKICETIESNIICPAENVVSLFGVVGEPTDLTVVVDENNFTPLDRECCDILGYYYGNTRVTVDGLDDTYFIEPSEVTSFILEDSENSCFECPREIEENTLIDIDGNTITYLSLPGIVDPGDSNKISEKCCTQYGFNYGSVQVSSTGNSGPIYNLCLKCDINNIIVDNDTNTVTDVNGDFLEKSCCENLGYHYEVGEKVGSGGCFICPPFTDTNYLLVNELIGNSTITTVTDVNGQNLSRNCCFYYRVQSKNTAIIYDENRGCYFETN
jgi:hypothetical protein